MNLTIPDFGYDDEKHKYTYKGEALSGVTTILKPLPKPALIQWSANLASEYWKSKLTDELAVSNDLGAIDLESIHKDARVAYAKKRDKSADTGQDTHSWYEDYAKTGKMGELPKALSQSQADKIVAWRKDNKVKTIANEVPMCSPKYLYGMTFDEIAEVNGKLALIDLKTTSGTSWEQHLQTAAYQQGVEEISGEKIAQRIILGIPQNSEVFEAVVVGTPFDLDFGAFLDTFRIYRMIQKYENEGWRWRRWR